MMSKKAFVTTKVAIVHTRTILNLKEHPVNLPKSIHVEKDDVLEMVTMVGCEEPLPNPLTLMYNFSKSSDRAELKNLATVAGIDYGFEETENHKKTLRIIARIEDIEAIPVAFGYNDADLFYIVNGDGKLYSQAETLQILKK